MLPVHVNLLGYRHRIRQIFVTGADAAAKYAPPVPHVPSRLGQVTGKLTGSL